MMGAPWNWLLCSFNMSSSFKRYFLSFLMAAILDVIEIVEKLFSVTEELGSGKVKEGS
jgi:hypothetical protein